MDIITHDYLLRSPAVAETAAKRAAERATRKRANDNMPDNKGVGWRKKIHYKPKELQPFKLGVDDTAATEDPSDRRRHHGWRKTIQGSRPATPVSGPPATPTIDEVEDVQGELTEPAIRRRNSKPKLTRYTSLFSGFNALKDTTKILDFTEPWSDGTPPFESYVDPKFAIQSIRSHMVTFSRNPVPLEYNNSLFCIFENYDKLRNQNDRLDTVLQETRQNFEYAEDQWAKEELRYEEEIRRLELLIAQGATGVAGVMSARQGTVVARKRRHRRTMSNGRQTLLDQFLTQEQIDHEIRLRSQQVLLQRPISPSAKMTVLSSKFTGTTGGDVCVGTPPNRNRNPTLSRKVQSELNLSKLGHMVITKPVAEFSLTSEFSVGVGDPLPGERSSLPPAPVEMTVDCDVVIALRELGALVARRRGLDINSFVSGLMTLLAETDESDNHTENVEISDTEQKSTDKDPSPRNQYTEKVISSCTLQRFQSQLQLATDQQNRCHFSFEPGEDYLQAPNKDLVMTDALQSYDDSSESTSSVSGDLRKVNIESPLRGVTSPYHVSNLDTHNVSKIPSPVQVFGSVRRETSVSSLRSTLARTNDGRHDSQPSILTAYRQNYTGNPRPEPCRRSSSSKVLCGIDKSLSSKDQSSKVRIRNNVTGLATTRAAENATHAAVTQGDSPTQSSTKLSTAGSSFRTS